MSMPIFLALLAWSGIGLAAILLVAVVFAVMIRIENRAKRVAASLTSQLARRAKPASLFARMFLVPQMSGWEKALVWLVVLIVCVIGWKMYGLFELGLVR